MFFEKLREPDGSAARTGDPTSFGDIFGAAFDSARVVDSSNASLVAMERAYDQRIKAATDAGFAHSLVNPMRMSQGSTAPEFGLPDQDDPYASFDRQLRELATNEKDPTKIAALKLDRSVREDAKEIAREAEARFNSVWERAPNMYGAGAVARFGGGFAGAATDPVNIAALAAGPWGRVGVGAKNLLWMGAKTGAVNAGAETAIQPFVQKWRKEAGLDYGISHAAENIGTAFALGFGLDTAVRGGFRGIQRGLGREPIVENGVVTGYRRPLPADEALEIAAQRANTRSPIRQAADGDLDALNRMTKEAGVADDPAMRGAKQAAEIEAEIAGKPPGMVDESEGLSKLAQTMRAMTDDAEPPPVHADPVLPTRKGFERLADDGPNPPAKFKLDGKPVAFREVPAASIGFDAETFQFKGGGNAQGVTQRLLGVEQWDPIAAGRAIVWEKADGSLVIADGHQRLALAKRLEQTGHEPIGLQATVFREADGWTAGDIRALAARKNLQEGSGDVLDAARAIRERPDVIDSSVPLTAYAMRQARALAKLSDEAFGEVMAGSVAPNHAALVGDLVEAKSQHAPILRALGAAEPNNEREARHIIGDLLHGPQHEVQEVLLGGHANTMLLQERAQVLDRALKLLKEDAQIFAILSKEADRIAQIGNRLAIDANADRVLKSEMVAGLIETLAARAGPVREWLDEAARAVAGGRPPKTVAQEFADDVRQQLLTHGLDGLKPEPPAPLRGRGIDDPAGAEARAQVAELEEALDRSVKSAMTKVAERNLNRWLDWQLRNKRDVPALNPLVKTEAVKLIAAGEDIKDAIRLARESVAATESRRQLDLAAAEAERAGTARATTPEQIDAVLDMWRFVDLGKRLGGDDTKASPQMVAFQAELKKYGVTGAKTEAEARDLLEGNAAKEAAERAGKAAAADESEEGAPLKAVAALDEPIIDFSSPRQGAPSSEVERRVQIGPASIRYEVEPDGTVYLAYLRTFPEGRGIGAARYAMEVFLGEADRAGKVVTLVVEGAKGMDDARLGMFYASLGFREGKDGIWTREPNVAPMKAVTAEEGRAAPAAKAERHLTFGKELGTHADIKTNYPDADFWIIRKGTPDKVGSVTREFSPEHIGVKVRNHNILPDYMYYALMHVHQQGYFKERAHGTTRLQNIKLSDVKDVPVEGLMYPDIFPMKAVGADEGGLRKIRFVDDPDEPVTYAKDAEGNTLAEISPQGDGSILIEFADGRGSIVAADMAAAERAVRERFEDPAIITAREEFERGQQPLGSDVDVDRALRLRRAMDALYAMEGQQPKQSEVQGNASEVAAMQAISEAKGDFDVAVKLLNIDEETDAVAVLTRWRDQGVPLRALADPAKAEKFWDALKAFETLERPYRMMAAAQRTGRDMLPEDDGPGAGSGGDWIDEHWAELSRRSQRIEHLAEPTERVLQRIVPKSALEMEADDLFKAARALEAEMRQADASADEIAKAVNERFGSRVTAEEVRSGKVWWRTAELDAAEKKAARALLDADQMGELERLWVDPDLTVARIAERMSEVAEKPVTPRQIAHIAASNRARFPDRRPIMIEGGGIGGKPLLNADELAELDRLWATKLSVPEIAEQMRELFKRSDISDVSINWQATRNRERFPDRRALNRGSSEPRFWTEPRMAELERVWADGSRSIADVAAHMSEATGRPVTAEAIRSLAKANPERLPALRDVRWSPGEVRMLDMPHLNGMGDAEVASLFSELFGRRITTGAVRAQRARAAASVQAPAGPAPTPTRKASVPSQLVTESMARAAIKLVLTRGDSAPIRPEVVDGALQTLKTMADAVPEGVKVGVLMRVEPIEGLSKVRALYRKLDGSLGEIIGPWSHFDGTRAVYFGGNMRTVVFFRAGFSGRFEHSLRGELWHELVHVVRNIDAVDGRVFDLLVSHANRLRILDLSLNDYLEKVGRSDAVDTTGETLRQRYERLYGIYRDKPERLNQEAVAHLVELIYHRALPIEDIRPVATLLEQLFNGQSEHFTKLLAGIEAEPPMFAIVGQQARSADLVLLEMAQMMERAGRSESEIFAKTNWFRDALGTWASERSDLKTKLTPAAETFMGGREGRTVTGTPESILLDAPQLDDYPELRNIKVSLEKNVRELPAGLADLEAGEIYVRAGTPREAAKKLVVELHRFIARHEGMPEGGTPASALEVIRQAQADLDTKMGHLLEQFDAIPKLRGPVQKLFGHESDADVLVGQIATLKAMRDELDSLPMREAYRRLGGSVMGRVIERRFGWTQEMRGRVSPGKSEDVPRSHQILAKGPARQFATEEDWERELWEDMSRRSHLIDQAVEQRDQRRAAVKDIVAEKPHPLQAEVANFERAQLKAGKTLGEVAAAIEEKFGFPVDPLALAKREVWWRIDEIVKAETRARSSDIPWTFEVDSELARLHAAGVPVEQMRAALADPKWLGRMVSRPSIENRLREKGLVAIRRKGLLSDLWTEPRNAELRQYSADRLSIGEIMTRLQESVSREALAEGKPMRALTERMVREHIRRLKLESPPKADVWSEQRDALLIRLYEETPVVKTERYAVVAGKFSEATGREFKAKAVYRRLLDLGVIQRWKNEWTPEMFAMLTSDEVAALSTAEAAKLMNQRMPGLKLTRNSIVRQRNRLAHDLDQQLQEAERFGIPASKMLEEDMGDPARVLDALAAAKEPIIETWRYVKEIKSQPVPERLAAFLRKSGGLRDDGKELTYAIGGSKAMPGLIAKAGMSLNDATLRAWEAGYLAGTERPAVSDLLEALASDLRGTPIVREIDKELWDLHVRVKEMDDELARYGIQSAKNEAEARATLGRRGTVGRVEGAGEEGVGGSGGAPEGEGGYRPLSPDEEPPFFAVGAEDPLPEWRVSLLSAHGRPFSELRYIPMEGPEVRAGEMDLTSHVRGLLSYRSPHSKKPGWHPVSQFTTEELRAYLGADLADQLLAQPIKDLRYAPGREGAVTKGHELVGLKKGYLGEHWEMTRGRAAADAERAAEQAARDAEWDDAAPFFAVAGRGWPQEVEDALRSPEIAKLSAAKAAQRLNELFPEHQFTKNMVIGKRDRDGLENSGYGSRVTPEVKAYLFSDEVAAMGPTAAAKVLNERFPGSDFKPNDIDQFRRIERMGWRAAKYAERDADDAAPMKAVTTSDILTDSTEDAARTQHLSDLVSVCKA